MNKKPIDGCRAVFSFNTLHVQYQDAEALEVLERNRQLANLKHPQW
jgi:hypothetical protein